MLFLFFRFYVIHMREEPGNEPTWHVWIWNMVVNSCGNSTTSWLATILSCLCVRKWFVRCTVTFMVTSNYGCQLKPIDFSGGKEFHCRSRGVQENKWRILKKYLCLDYFSGFLNQPEAEKHTRQTWMCPQNVMFGFYVSDTYRFLKDCSDLMRRMNCMRGWRIHRINTVCAIVHGRIKGAGVPIYMPYGTAR